MIVQYRILIYVNSSLPKQLPSETQECTGPFQFDLNAMKQLGTWKPTLPKLQLDEFDLGFVQEEVVVPSLSDVRAK